MADVSGGKAECCDAQHSQGKDLQRCEEASNRVQQAARVQGNEEHQQEVDRAIQEKRQRAFAGQRRQAHFERYGRGTWRREQRTNGQIARSRQQSTSDFTDRTAQCIHCTTNLGQCDNGDHRQTNGGDQETQRRHPDIRPGLQTDDRREDDVASPDKQGERHKTKCQDVLAFQHFH